MRRLLRWIFNGAAVLSAVLFVATCVMWARSYVVWDCWDNGHGDGTADAISSEAGEVFVAHNVFGLQRPGWRWMPQPAAPLPAGFPHGFALEYPGHSGPHDGEFVGLRFPHWGAGLTLAILPALRLFTLLRRRRPAGCCSRCGYDLRATPDV